MAGALFTFVIVLLYLGLGVAVPAAVIAARGEAEGGVGPLRTEPAHRPQEEGKELFSPDCKSCHTSTRSRPTGSPAPTSTSSAASTGSAC